MMYAVPLPPHWPTFEGIDRVFYDSEAATFTLQNFKSGKSAAHKVSQLEKYFNEAGAPWESREQARILLDWLRHGNLHRSDFTATLRTKTLLLLTH